jgi:hypothetical protein
MSYDGSSNTAPLRTFQMSGTTFTGNVIDPSDVAGSNFGQGGAARIAGGAGATISGTITNNDAQSYGGGFSIDTIPAVTISNSTITGNDANTNGGGLFSKPVFVDGSLSTLTLTNNTINNNRADADNNASGAIDGSGGGIFQERGNLTVSGGTIGGSGTPNTAYNGGGIGHAYEGPPTASIINTSTITVNSTSITHNTARGAGGGIFHDSFNQTTNTTSTLNLGTTTNVPLTNNLANVDGGGIAVSNNAVANLTRVTVQSNKADNDNNNTGDGGGVFNTTGGAVTIGNNSPIGGSTAGQGNSARNGGGLAIAGGTLTYNGVAPGGGIIQRNSVTSNGGGVFVSGGTATLTNQVVTDNNAATSGGAFFVSGGTLNVSLSRVVNNTAPTGSAITRTAGTATVENNWWGCDGFPGDAGCQGGSGTFDANPRIDLRLSASPAAVLLGGSSTLTADVTKNTDGANTNGGNAPVVLVGLPLTFDAGPKGTINAPLVVNVPANGMVTKTFTANANSAACGPATPSVTLDSGTQNTTVTVQCPDLTATKANNVSNSAVVGQTWTWTITVTNGGNAAGTFPAGSAVLSDSLPDGANISYGSPTASVGGVSCAISGTKDLTCNATSAVTLAASGGNFNVGFTAVAGPPGTAVGPYANPRSGGAAAVDPADAMVESNEGNNAFNNTVTVTKANTTAAVVSDTPDPTVVGEAYTVAASVSVASPGSGTPTGTITVSDGSQTCTITLPATSCQLTSTTAGAKTLTATYNGDVNYNASPASTGAAHSVSKANTTATIGSNTPNPSVVGQAVAVSYGVTVNSPGAGTPTGNVTVTASTGETCTATVAAGTCNITLTTAGARTLTAAYGGDSNFNSSPASSPATAHTVDKADTTAAITADTPDPSVTGQAYAVTASVAVSSPGAGTPTGTITVSDGAGNTCTITLPATSCSLTSTTAGAKTLTATYNGDSNYNASPASAGVSHAVNKADTVVTITSDSPDPSEVNQQVTVNFTVAAGSPGAGTPTGNVVVTVSGGGETCTGTAAAGTCSLTLTVGGNRTITATYEGDSNFNASSDTEAHTVTAPPDVSVRDAKVAEPASGTANMVFTVALSAPATGAVSVDFTTADQTATAGTAATPGAGLRLHLRHGQLRRRRAGQDH